MDALSGSHPKMDWEATDLVTAWKSFQQHTEFWFAGPLAKTAEAQKCNYLMIWIGNKGRDIYSTWDLSEDDKKKLEVHYQNFEKHVRPKSNKIYSRYKFLSRVQKEIDTFEEYLTDLKILVKDCGYATPEEMVRDAIVFGTKDHKVREKCITEGSELSLEKAINFARTYELSKAQLKTMESEDKTINMLNKQGSRSSGKKYGKQYTPQRGPPQNNKGQSPNFANKCKNCGATIDNQELNTDEWTETINVNDVPVNFQLDTGAKCNVLSLNKLKTICSHPIITKQVSPLRSYSGHIIDTVGVLDRAREYNLKLSAGKCEISKPEVTYVGHRLTSEGVKPDPEKIRAVNKMSKPDVGASSKGLGAVLIQNQKPVAYASRALTQTQQRYPQIEKETLAIVYGCNKFHEYVYGRRVQIETDHKPLQSIFLKPLHQTPPRLQRLLIALEKYDLKVDYKPGKEMYLADHLSRSFLKETKEVLVPDLHVNDIHLISYLPIAPEMYAKFQKETANDEHLQELQDVIFDGWPNEKSELLHSLRPYWTYRDELSVIDGLLYKSNKAIVPKALQNEMLDKIHESHLGIVKCKSRARDVLFWIGMGQDIEDKVKACGLCAQHQSLNAKEPIRNRRHIRPTAYNENTVDKEHFKNNHNSTVRKTSTVCNTSQTLDRSETVASEENERIEPSKSPVTRSGRTIKVPTKLNDYVK
ncbi:unnamed protein product [Mytilus edulis]|uniref:Uncharacterized protein n=1 Tax=Mytilus edulis TaxID=6550 RepID=A0A8S3S996_MYTED|nr:unnamed protein product [Mytilus edulis]